MRLASGISGAKRAGRYWPMFLWPCLVLGLGLGARLWLLPRMDRWLAGPPPLDVLDAREIGPAERGAAKLPDELVGAFGTVPGRHWTPITCAAASPDGKWLATGSEEQLVCLWETAGLRTTAMLTDASDRLQLLMFSPDSKHLAAASASEVHLYKLTGGQPQLAAKLAVTGPLQALNFSADGSQLVLGNGNDVIEIWDLGVAPPSQIFTGPAEHELVRALALSENGKLLAVGAGPQSELAAVYEVEQRRLIQKARLKSIGTSHALVFSPNLKALAAIDANGWIKLIDVAADKVRADLEGSGPWLAFAADGKTVVTCTFGGTVRFWDLTAEGARVRNVLLLKHGSAPEWLAFSADLRLVISGGGGAVRLWDISGSQAQLRGTLQNKQPPALALAFAPDGKTLAVGGWFPKSGPGETGEEGGVQLWDLSSKQPKERARFGGHAKEVAWVAFAPNGKMLASAAKDNSVRIWDLAGQVKERTALQGANGPLAFSPSGKNLATAVGGTIQLWTVGGSELGRWAKYSDPKNPENAITALAFAPDGTALASGTKNRTVDIWALGGALPGERITLDDPQIGLVVSYTPDARGLITVASAGSVHYYDLTGPTPKQKPRLEINIVPPKSEQVVAIAANGRMIAQAAEQVVAVWSLSTGKQYLWQLPGEVRALAFAPDNRHLATANSNGTVYIFRLPRSVASSPRPKGAPEN